MRAHYLTRHARRPASCGPRSPPGPNLNCTRRRSISGGRCKVARACHSRWCERCRYLCPCATRTLSLSTRWSLILHKCSWSWSSSISISGCSSSICRSPSQRGRCSMRRLRRHRAPSHTIACEIGMCVVCCVPLIPDPRVGAWQVKCLAMQLLSALAAVHECFILHRCVPSVECFAHRSAGCQSLKTCD